MDSKARPLYTLSTRDPPQNKKHIQKVKGWKKIFHTNGDQKKAGVAILISLLGIHTEETRSERDTCTPMFIAALFIIARTWKQPRCPPADEWIRKLWYIYTMDYYSDIKKIHLNQF